MASAEEVAVVCQGILRLAVPVVKRDEVGLSGLVSLCCPPPGRGVFPRGGVDDMVYRSVSWKEGMQDR